MKTVLPVRVLTPRSCTVDHSLLPGDYLNASVIPPFPTSGHADRRSYIASQAPLPHTLPIFYANLIARKVSLVVNLTAFTEHGRVKSDEYWPMKKGQVWESGPYRLQQRRDPQLISDATLTTSSTLYSLRLENKEKDKEQQHDFALLHVTSWPDFGAFSSSVFAALLDLIDKTANKGQDIWVHCSAGIGRSGTVIAALLARDLGPQLASALQLGRLTTPSMVVEGALQAAQKLVDHERRYRPKMVQTADQLGMVANAVGVLLQQREE